MDEAGLVCAEPIGVVQLYPVFETTGFGLYTSAASLGSQENGWLLIVGGGGDGVTTPLEMLQAVLARDDHDETVNS